MAHTYSFLDTYTYNGVTYKKGDAIVVTGHGWSTTNKPDEEWTANYTNKSVYFYGFARFHNGEAEYDGLHPLTVCSSASATADSILCYMEMDAIISGGTPTHGCAVYLDGAYRYGDFYVCSNGNYVKAKSDAYKMQSGLWTKINE